MGEKVSSPIKRGRKKQKICRGEREKSLGLSYFRICCPTIRSHLPLRCKAQPLIALFDEPDDIQSSFSVMRHRRTNLVWSHQHHSTSGLPQTPTVFTPPMLSLAAQASHPTPREDSTDLLLSLDLLRHAQEDLRGSHCLHTGRTALMHQVNTDLRQLRQSTEVNTGERGAPA